MRKTSPVSHVSCGASPTPSSAARPLSCLRRAKYQTASVQHVSPSTPHKSSDQHGGSTLLSILFSRAGRRVSAHCCYTRSTLAKAIAFVQTVTEWSPRHAQTQFSQYGVHLTRAAVLQTTKSGTSLFLNRMGQAATKEGRRAPEFTFLCEGNAHRFSLSERGSC